MTPIDTDSQMRNNNEINQRTKALLDIFKKNYLETKSDDFVGDATGNMLVCLSAYAKIFEGFLVISARRNMPQEMTDGFVKWAIDQLDELKISLNGMYDQKDMR